MLCIRLGWNSNSASASLVFAMHEKETDVSLTKSNVSINKYLLCKNVACRRKVFHFLWFILRTFGWGNGGSHFKVNWHEKRLVRFSFVAEPAR